MYTPRILCVIFLMLVTPKLISTAVNPDVFYDEYIRSLIDLEMEFQVAKSIKEEKDKFLCISLGFNCVTALKLETYGLRTRSFPFDWNITPLFALCDLIDNHFEDFLNPQCLVRRYDIPLLSNFILNQKYNLALAHDFPLLEGNITVHNYIDFLEDVDKKYQRRIKRFYNVCNMAEKVYFFRLRFEYWPLDNEPQDRVNVMRLRDVLLRQFPDENWTLVVIGTSDDYKNDWNMFRVVNCYITDGNDAEWGEIFKRLGLIV